MIDGGEEGSVNISDEGIMIEGGEEGSVKISDGGIIIDGAEQGNVNVSGTGDLMIDGINIDEMTDISNMLDLNVEEQK